MINFNIFIGALSFLSGLGNIVVGMNSPFYSNVDLLLAIAQIFLAVVVVLSGLSKKGILIKNDFLSKLHSTAVVAFYMYIFIGCWFFI